MDHESDAKIGNTA